MAATRRRWSDRALRPPMCSPGRPPLGRREHRQRFWEEVARGLSSEEAAVAAGVSPAVGARWFRQCGGMSPLNFRPLSRRYLSFVEREEIAVLQARDCGVREIARQLRRSSSTISRELRRNAATRDGNLEYRATTAQWHADRRAKRPKVAKLAANGELRQYVQDRLGGLIAAPDGAAVPGPHVRWIGRRRGRRQDRRWAASWSPEQIANRLRVDFPDDESMRISHEAIYQALYVQGRGALRRELTACLRTGRALRVPRARARGRGKTFVRPEIMITERPAEADDRAVSRALGGRPNRGAGQLGDRNAGRADLPVHDAAPPPPPQQTRRAQDQEQSSVGRARCRSRPGRDRFVDHEPARATSPVPDMGPGSRDGSARTASHRHWPGHLLLRPTEPLAARHQRKHQRLAETVLPQRH